MIDIMNPPKAALVGAIHNKVAMPIANSEKITNMPTTVACSIKLLKSQLIGELVE